MSSSINPASVFVATQNAACAELLNNPASRSALVNRAQGVANNPEAVFLTTPNDTTCAVALVKADARERLPQDVAAAKVSENGEDIKTLIGMIRPSVLAGNNPDDIARLDTICKGLIAAGGSDSKEAKLEGQLSALVQQYATAGIEKLADKFIGQCEEAWQRYQQIDPDKAALQETFTTCLQACKTLVMSKIGRLHEADSMTTLAQNTRHVINACASISKTLNFSKPEAAPALTGAQPVNAAPLEGPQGPFIPAGQAGSAIVINRIERGALTKSALPNTTAHWLPASLEVVFKSELSKTDQIRLADKLIDRFTGSQADFLSQFEHVEGLNPSRDPGTASAVAPSAGVDQPESSPPDAVGEDTIDGDTATDNITQFVTLTNAGEGDTSQPVAEGTAAKKPLEDMMPEPPSGLQGEGNAEAAEETGGENGVAGNLQRTDTTSSAGHHAFKPSTIAGTAAKKPSAVMTAEPPSGLQGEGIAKAAEETAEVNIRKNSVVEPKFNVSPNNSVFATVRTNDSWQRKVPEQLINLKTDERQQIEEKARRFSREFTDPLSAPPASRTRDNSHGEYEFVKKLNNLRKVAP